MAVLLPTMLMLLFTYVFGGALDPSGGYVDYVVPGIILLCAGFGAELDGALRRPRHDHGHHRPVPHDAAAGERRARRARRGERAAQPVRDGGRDRGRAARRLPADRRRRSEWIAAIGLIALYILAITSLFAAIGLAASSPDAANAYGFILLFLPYLSSAFVPVETLPGWLAWFAEHQPITPIIEAIRSLLMGTPMGDSAWWAVGWCLLVIAVAAVWGSWLFRRKAGRR